MAKRKIDYAVVKKFKHYFDHPVDFVRDMFKVEPKKEQILILNSIAKNKRTVIKSGHGIGKSASYAWAIIWFLSTRMYARVPCTAPTYHQLQDILWAEVDYWLSRSVLRNYFTFTERKLGPTGFAKAWFAVPISCTKPENMQGFHGKELEGGHLLFLIDEASGVNNEMFEVIEGALTGENAKLSMAGNPTQMSGEFFDSFGKNNTLCENFTFSSEDSELVSPEYIERMAKKYGKESDIYRVRVKGEFPKGAPDCLIQYDKVMQAVYREVEPTDCVAIGVDPARFGDDESVICWRHGDQVKPIHGFYGIDTVWLTGEVLHLVREIRKWYPVEKIIRVMVDDSGLGGGVTDMLIDENKKDSIKRILEFNIEVIGVVNNGVSMDPEYEDLGSSLWGNIRNILDEISLPDDDEMAAQLTTRRYDLNRNGKIKLERKEDMKKKGIGSPDRADAVALCLMPFQAAVDNFRSMKMETGSERKRDPGKRNKY